MAMPLQTALAKGALSDENTRLALNFGYANQSFVVTRSDFDHFDTFYYGARLGHSWGIWSLGLEYSVASGANVKKFTLSDNSVGTYDLEFQRINVLFGLVFEEFAMHLIVGSETVNWSGAPQLAPETAAFVHYGVDFGYDYAFTPVFKAPIMLTVLSHPERRFVFNSYPADSLTVQSSVEIQVGTGLAIDF